MVKNPAKGKFIVLEGTEGSGKTTQLSLLVSALEKREWGGPALQIAATREPTDKIFGKLARSIYQQADATNDPSTISLIVDRFLQNDGYRWLGQRMLNAPGAMQRRPHLSTFDRIGRDIRSGRMEELPWLLVLAFILDRFQHRVEQEIAWLETGAYVVSDRDFLSGLAHADSEGFAWREVLQTHEEILGSFFIVPDLVIFLDVPVEVGLTRTAVKQHDRRERFDTAEQQARIRNAYHAILNDPLISDTIPSITIDGSPENPSVVHRTLWEKLQPFLQEWSR